MAANGGDDAGDVDDQLPAQRRDMTPSLDVADGGGPHGRHAAEAEIRGLPRLAFTKLQTNYDNLIDSAFTLIGALSREYLKDITRASYFLTRILRHAGIIESA